MEVLGLSLARRSHLCEHIAQGGDPFEKWFPLGPWTWHWAAHKTWNIMTNLPAKARRGLAIWVCLDLVLPSL